MHELAIQIINREITRITDNINSKPMEISRMRGAQYQGGRKKYSEADVQSADASYENMGETRGLLRESLRVLQGDNSGLSE